MSISCCNVRGKSEDDQRHEVGLERHVVVVFERSRVYPWGKDWTGEMRVIQEQRLERKRQ